METILEDGDAVREWIKFAGLSKAGQFLMEDMANAIEKEIGHLLHASKTPSNVTRYVSPKGNAEGSLVLRAGINKSKVDFVLGSWMRYQLANNTLGVATLCVILNQETDAPHFLFEYIEKSSENLVLLLDLLPRKDVVAEPDYLKRFYDGTVLESIRQTLEKAPQSQPYASTSLYVRSVVSPTAICYKIHNWLPTGESGAEALTIAVKEFVYPIAHEVFATWLNAFRNLGKEVKDDLDRRMMLNRDAQIKRHGIEADLSANLPKLFGQKIAERVVSAYRTGH